jgi:SAM-dependent methyltransferase
MLQLLSRNDANLLRTFLRDTGYNTDSLLQSFGRVENPKVHILKMAIVERSLAPTALHTLFRWFWIDVPVDAAIARSTIPEYILELLLQAGMVAEDDGAFRSAVRISVFNELFILSDHVVARTGALDANTVLWPNPTSMLCYQLCIQTPVERILDLGTGNGIIALAVAAHCKQIIATDLNPRARQFCEFNARLNGIDNLEFREGSAFEPVRGEHFDLIIGNPPFFITPEVRRVYSDNSMELDGFCRMLIRQAPEYLVEGGYCQLMVEWVQLKGQPWQERLTEWVSAIGCDALILSSYVQSSLDYTLVRAEEDRDELADASSKAALVDRWLEYFENRQVESIHGGIVMIRKRLGPNWVRMAEATSQPSAPFGDFLKSTFETRDALDRPDEELLEMRPSLRPSCRMDKGYSMTNDGWRLTSLDLRLCEALPASLSLQPQVAEFLGSCTGKRTLKELAVQLASSLSIDPEAVTRECCAIVRRLADRGMIVFNRQAQPAAQS